MIESPKLTYTELLNEYKNYIDVIFEKYEYYQNKCRLLEIEILRLETKIKELESKL